ncbi:MAG TPA: cupredoxin domain-containing protein [Dehalococcoidia bacterium]
MRLAPALFLLLVPVLFVAACGDNDDGGDGVATETPNLFPSQAPPQQQPDPVQAIDATLAEPVDGVIEVTLADILFSPNYLHVPLEGSVTIRLTNNDPATHTMRVAGIDGRYDTEDDAVVPTIGPDAVEELTFAGAAAGAYTFRCDLHPGSMGGIILVD